MTAIILAVGGAGWMRQLAKELEAILAPRVVGVIIENSYSTPNKFRQLKKRLRRYGILATLDQVCLQLYLGCIATDYGKLSQLEAFTVPTLHCEDINQPGVAEFITQNKADFVISLGVGVMRPATFNAAIICTINLHTGITPRFRGVNPNLWAIYEKEEALLGVTVHQIDSGIDTGPVLRQKKIAVNKNGDNIEAITLRSYRAGIAAVAEIIEDFEKTHSMNVQPASDETPKTYGWYGLSHYLKVQKMLKNRT